MSYIGTLGMAHNLRTVLDSAARLRRHDDIRFLIVGDGAEVLALVPSHHNHAIGEKIGIRLDIDHVVAFRGQDEHHPRTAQ